MNGVSPGIRKRGKRAQVHPGAGQQNAPGTGGDQTARCEEILIGAILEENAVCPGNAYPVQRTGQRLQRARVFQGRPQAGDVGQKPDAQMPAGHAAVYIGLDVEGKYRLRLLLPQDGQIAQQEPSVLKGIFPVAVVVNADKRAAHGLQLRPKPTQLADNGHPVAGGKEPPEQRAAQIICIRRVVCKYCNLHFLYRAPSWVNTSLTVFSIQDRSIPTQQFSMYFMSKTIFWSGLKSYPPLTCARPVSPGMTAKRFRNPGIVFSNWS